MNDLLRCGNCSAPLHADAQQPLVICKYCGYQTRTGAIAQTPPPPLATPPAGPRLLETVSVKITDTLAVPLLSAGAALPTSHAETLSTQTDNQDAIHVELLVGNAATVAANRVLVKLSLPLVQRKPRGAAFGELTLRVEANGAASVTVAEKGAQSAVRQDGLVVPVG